MIWILVIFFFSSSSTQFVASGTEEWRRFLLRANETEDSATAEATELPSLAPTSLPSDSPTTLPTAQATRIPTISPTSVPTPLPKATPTAPPLTCPTYAPTALPSSRTSPSPSTLSTATPTKQGTESTALPTMAPYASYSPTGLMATETPTSEFSAPTTPPTSATNQPSISYSPTGSSTVMPSIHKSSSPSSIPTTATYEPASSYAPTRLSTVVPSQEVYTPTALPTSDLEKNYSSEMPTIIPTLAPSQNASSALQLLPTMLPSMSPSWPPTPLPSHPPTWIELESQNSSSMPSAIPTPAPTILPPQSENSTAPPSQRPTILTGSITSWVPTSLPSTQSMSSPPSENSTPMPSFIVDIPSPTTLQPNSSSQEVVQVQMSFALDFGDAEAFNVNGTSDVVGSAFVAAVDYVYDYESIRFVAAPSRRRLLLEETARRVDISADARVSTSFTKEEATRAVASSAKSAVSSGALGMAMVVEADTIGFDAIPDEVLVDSVLVNESLDLISNSVNLTVITTRSPSSEPSFVPSTVPTHAPTGESTMSPSEKPQAASSTNSKKKKGSKGFSLLTYMVGVLIILVLIGIIVIICLQLATASTKQTVHISTTAPRAGSLEKWPEDHPTNQKNVEGDFELTPQQDPSSFEDEEEGETTSPFVPSRELSQDEEGFMLVLEDMAQPHLDVMDESSDIENDIQVTSGTPDRHLNDYEWEQMLSDVDAPQAPEEWNEDVASILLFKLANVRHEQPEGFATRRNISATLRDRSDLVVMLGLESVKERGELDALVLSAKGDAEGHLSRHQFLQALAHSRLDEKARRDSFAASPIPALSPEFSTPTQPRYARGQQKTEQRLMIRVNVALRRAFSTMSASTTNWETLYYQKEKELQRVDEDSWKECERLALDKLDLIKAQQQLISKNEKLEGFLRKIHTDMQALSAERALELTELEVLKRRIRNEKRRALKDQELVTYRHLIRAVFSKEIGSLAHNDIRRYFRRNSFLLSRYRADRLLHDGLNIKDDTMSERKRGAAFGFAVAYAWLDLFDCIENAPYETFAFTHDIDLRPPQNSQLQFSDVDLTLLYHFFEVNNYPVRHPFPDASGNTEPADYDDDDILRAAI